METTPPVPAATAAVAAAAAAAPPPNPITMAAVAVRQRLLDVQAVHGSEKKVIVSQSVWSPMKLVAL